jgi:archaemetzincin
MKEDRFPDLERHLAPLAVPLAGPRPGDWLWEHDEPGQSFAAYRAQRPLRRGARLHTLYLTLIGDFTPRQEQLVEATVAYLEAFFDAPVRRRGRAAVTDLPAEARRGHPFYGHEQLHSTHILTRLLLPGRPDDALADLAITAVDLWAGEGWNFVFGEAAYGSAVWSLSRFGDPSSRPCLLRALGTAAHETGHVLGMDHCIEYECMMNGCNSLDESDRKPFHLCPPCLRKLCWNLQVGPRRYLRRLEGLMRAYGLDEEAAWHRQARAALGA